MDDPAHCPLPKGHYDRVVMAHGGGGRLMQQLIETLIGPIFRNPHQELSHDSARVPLGQEQLAFTTDSFVVKPLFFKGGDIGKIAVLGTVNDLAMAGAQPLYLSVGLILEEGLPLQDLKRILVSMATTAEAAGVQLVTGDTKVVERGSGDGLYINTAGIGSLRAGIAPIHPKAIAVGDAVLISGDIGRHGLAILAAREHLSLDTDIQSDCRDLSQMVKALLDAGISIHCLRDLTRGGLASALIEIAETAEVQMVIEETEIPLQPDVEEALELLGFDPLFVANEGCFALFLEAEEASRALEILKRHPEGVDARLIGSVTGSKAQGQVLLRTAFGTERLLTRLSGEQLPRIC